MPTIIYKILSTQTVKGTNYVYFDVEFVQGGKVIHKNDFILDIKPTFLEYTGRVDRDGELLDDTFIEHDTDLDKVIKDNVSEYVKNFAPFSDGRLDKRSKGIEKNDTDPLGIRADKQVTDLINKTFIVNIP